jgi:hypothetical protein
MHAWGAAGLCGHAPTQTAAPLGGGGGCLRRQLAGAWSAVAAGAYAVVHAMHLRDWALACAALHLSLRAAALHGRVGGGRSERPWQLPRLFGAPTQVDPLMAQRMATWCLWAVINHQRKMDALWRAQQEARCGCRSREARPG